MIGSGIKPFLTIFFDDDDVQSTEMINFTVLYVGHFSLVGCYGTPS